MGTSPPVATCFGRDRLDPRPGQRDQTLGRSLSIALNQQKSGVAWRGASGNRWHEASLLISPPAAPTANPIDGFLRAPPLGMGFESSDPRYSPGQRSTSLLRLTGRSTETASNDPQGRVSAFELSLASDQSRSNTTAIPWPPPTHMVTSAYWPPVRCSS